ncbi:SulP family inorganic anion transporter [Chenggangzhangella methanolivorans]|uniref:SulP family inorganic anion transporter n=1 Tax=Chenggangzhangella methanolivorans TaxID=1437009 RepID=UPI0028F4519B|nr:solute carrier family 23 protein [Chenggangzhangella methanolivorans]
MFANVFALPGLFEFGQLASPSVLLAALVIAVIASAETMLSVAAVDKMHDGPRAKYNRELGAQGVGNAVCGLFGALPMTGVIVRSSANVQAGARSRWSAILHGLWLLAFVAALPQALELVPTAALAGILIVTGWRLIQLEHARGLFQRHGALPAAVWAATLILVVAVDLLTGVLVGLALAMVEIVPHLRKRYLVVHTGEEKDGSVSVRLAGSATFLQLPQLEKALADVPAGTDVKLETRRLDYIDHTTREMLTEWADRRSNGGGARVHLERPSARHEERLAAALAQPER